MSSKRGRPLLGDLKNCDIKVRVDEKTNLKLIEYAKKHNITKAEAIRQSIKSLIK